MHTVHFGGHHKMSVPGVGYTYPLWNHTPYDHTTWDHTPPGTIHPPGPYLLTSYPLPLEGTWKQTGSDIIPPLWREWQTCLKTLPSRNFVWGGNNQSQLKQRDSRPCSGMGGLVGNQCVDQEIYVPVHYTIWSPLLIPPIESCLNHTG